MTLGKTNTVIGIIEDDVLLNQALNIALKNTGYSTICMYTKKDALSLIKDKVELLIIDIGLPDGNGIYLYQELQKKRKIPAIFLTARDEEKDMLEAFDIGADDYVVKPFSVKVLLKRIEVVLKRNEEEIISFGDLTLYLDRKQVFLYGKEILLTVKEYQLLEYLMVNQGQVITKENILEKIWGLDGQFVVDNTVSVTINRLRKKIEPDAKQPIYIKNVYGLGYRIGEK
ncbi:response regulator transcription factor [Blautia obeum]|uniref:response regulator transcription factor n=1 Tax=Blautia obeum TaxID=40520 RepID=UPI00306B0BE6|nr:response regulator transcription factor [Lachnospiraceae bacterium]MCI6534286.1 response regulator transcription factor [Lachnospiraceae bacterium]